MKKMTLTIAAILTLQAGVLFAGIDNDGVNASTASLSSVNIATLAPATPAEAAFEDIIPSNNDLFLLAPVTPSVADFTDLPDSASVADPGVLSPAPPAEADFE
jgi:hypothetical protein